MKKVLLVTILGVLGAEYLIAQSVAINNTGATANTSAILDVSSNNKGVLVPRMTKAQKNAIATPAIGLLIYQGIPDSIGFHYYNGNAWIWLQPQAGNDWKTTGNAGTDTAVNFIGTTDNEPILLKQNNQPIGLLNSNNGTYFLGAVAGRSNTTGAQNIAIGDSSLYANTTGESNVALGYKSLKNNVTGSNNTAVGYQALRLGSNSQNNSAFGAFALARITGGLNNVAVGVSSLSENTNGNFNTAVGVGSLQRNAAGSANNSFGGQALQNNTTGSNNNSMGYNSLQSTTTGSRNVAIGTAALYSNRTGNSNIGIGANSLLSNLNGSNNVALGDSAAQNSIGSDIVAIGSKSLFNNTTGEDNVAVGTRSLFANSIGYLNVALGNYALYSNSSGYSNTAIGYNALYANTTGQGNLAAGDGALTRNTTASGNVGLGYFALNNNTTGGNNTAIGEFAMRDNSTGLNNVAIGAKSLRSKVNGFSNVAIGAGAGADNYNGSNNVFIGDGAGTFNNGSSNVFIGTDAGRNSTASNQLFIDNSSTAAPLVFGDFSTNLLRVNGTLNINNDYSFPAADGTANQVLYTNGAGVVDWANAVATANNGLNVIGSIARLGGTLLDSTTITQGNRSMVFDLTGNGNFYVRKNSVEEGLVVKNNGFVGVNTNNPQFRVHVVNSGGGSGEFGRGIMVENTNTASNGEASIAFRNNGPGGIAANRAWMSGLNNTINYVVAYGDSLKASNVKFKIDTTGNVSIATQGLPAQSRLDVNGSFGNNIRVVGVNQTLGDDDHTIIISAGTGPITIVLPAASTCERREYVIVNRTGNSDKTISPAYNDFSGSSTSIAANSSITLQSNGTSWFRTR